MKKSIKSKKNIKRKPIKKPIKKTIDKEFKRPIYEPIEKEFKKTYEFKYSDEKAKEDFLNILEQKIIDKNIDNYDKLKKLFDEEFDEFIQKNSRYENIYKWNIDKNLKFNLYKIISDYLKNELEKNKSIENKERDKEKKLIEKDNVNFFIKKILDIDIRLSNIKKSYNKIENILNKYLSSIDKIYKNTKFNEIKIYIDNELKKLSNEFYNKIFEIANDEYLEIINQIKNKKNINKNFKNQMNYQLKILKEKIILIENLNDDFYNLYDNIVVQNNIREILNTDDINIYFDEKEKGKDYLKYITDSIILFDSILSKLNNYDISDKIKKQIDDFNNENLKILVEYYDINKDSKNKEIEQLLRKIETIININLLELYDNIKKEIENSEQKEQFEREQKEYEKFDLIDKYIDLYYEIKEQINDTSIDENFKVNRIKNFNDNALKELIIFKENHKKDNDKRTKKTIKEINEIINNNLIYFYEIRKAVKDNDLKKIQQIEEEMDDEYEDQELIELRKQINDDYEDNDEDENDDDE